MRLLTKGPKLSENPKGRSPPLKKKIFNARSRRTQQQQARELEVPSELSQGKLWPRRRPSPSVAPAAGAAAALSPAGTRPRQGDAAPSPARGGGRHA
jgi:hypothetical protein